MQRKPPRASSIAQPWLVIDGQPCEVTAAWLEERVGSRKAYRIALATYRWLSSYDGDDYLKWYDAGFLTEIDRLQDKAASERLAHGLTILHALFPRSCAKARTEVLAHHG